MKSPGLIVLLALTSAALTSAQVLDPLVVTATRDARSVSQLAYPVDVFDADTLRSHPGLALDDQLKASAAFSLFRRTSSLAANPTAQGVSLRNIGPSGAGRTLVLWDGIPLNDPFGGWVTWAKTSRLNLEAVEIVRGGGSGTWGSAALGGTIQVLSAKPGSTPRQAAAFEIGAFGTVSAELATTHAAGDGQLFLNARGLHSDGFPRKAPGSAGPIDRPTDLDQGYLQLGWSRQTQHGTTGTLSVRGFQEDRGNGTPLQRNETREVMIAAQADGTRDLWGDRARWTTTAYLQTQNYRSLFTAVDDARASESPVLDQYNVPADAAGASATATWGGGTATTTAGADARWVQGETRENYFRVNDVFIRNRIAGGTQMTAGVFANHQRTLADDWQVEVGARMDAWQLTDGSRIETDRTDGTVVRQDRFPDRADIEFSPRLGLVWTASDAWRWQAAAYQAFRLPTLNELYRPFRVGSVITEANPALATEQLDGLEIGTTWRGERGSVRVTAFRNQVEDAVANVTLGFGPGLVPGVGFVPSGGVGRQRQNLAQITIDGVEFAAQWQPSSALTWRVDYLWTDARDEASGRVLPQVSRHTVVAGLDWSPATAWRITVQGRYVSDAFEDDANVLVLDAATTWDVRMAYRFQNQNEVFLAVENLTDEAVISGRDAGGLIDLGTPRFLRGGVRWHW